MCHRNESVLAILAQWVSKLRRKIKEKKVSPQPHNIGH